jgi:hypothetical protein
MYNYGYFSDDTNKYSINLMFDYININKPTKIKLNITDLLFNLNWNSLKDNVKPIDILNDIKNKKYKHEVDRIKRADTTYPIIVDSNYNIIDGVHRYMKHILENKRKINVYIFNKSLMKKFIIH